MCQRQKKYRVARLHVTCTIKSIRRHTEIWNFKLGLPLWGTVIFYFLFIVDFIFLSSHLSTRLYWLIRLQPLQLTITSVSFNSLDHFFFFFFELSSLSDELCDNKKIVLTVRVLYCVYCILYVLKTCTDSVVGKCENEIRTMCELFFIYLSYSLHLPYRITRVQWIY